MAVTSGLYLQYTISDVTYSINDPDLDFNWSAFFVIPPDSTDISYWDDAVYAAVDAIVAINGASISQIKRTLVTNNIDNLVSLAALPYPKPS